MQNEVRKQSCKPLYKQIKDIVKEAFSMSAKHVIPITKKRGKIILPRKNGENHRFVIKN